MSISMNWVTVDCGGKCTRKQPLGGCCSAECAKDFAGYTPTGAANAYCQSNKCVCDTCAHGSGALEVGHACATNHNCRSHRCTSMATGCTGTCTEAEWRFEMDLYSDKYEWRGQSGDWIQVEFYYPGGRKEYLCKGRCFSTRHKWYTVRQTGITRRPSYVVVKSLGRKGPDTNNEWHNLSDAMYIDQAKFYTNGDYSQSWGADDGDSFKLAGNQWEEGYPCLKFVWEERKVYYCGTQFKGTNFDYHGLKALWV